MPHMPTLPMEEIVELPHFMELLATMTRVVKKKGFLYNYLIRQAQRNVNYLNSTGCCKHCYAYKTANKLIPLVNAIQRLSPEKILEKFNKYEEEGYGECLQFLFVNYCHTFRNDCLEILEQARANNTVEDYEHEKELLETVMKVKHYAGNNNPDEKLPGEA